MQHRDFMVIDHFDVRERIHTLKPPLLLIRGADDPAATPEYEREIHQAVPGSQYLKLKGCGHFPFAERPAKVNRAIDEFLATRIEKRDTGFVCCARLDRRREASYKVAKMSETDTLTRSSASA